MQYCCLVLPRPDDCVAYIAGAPGRFSVPPGAPLHFVPAVRRLFMSLCASCLRMWRGVQSCVPAVMPLLHVSFVSPLSARPFAVVSREACHHLPFQFVDAHDLFLCHESAVDAIVLLPQVQYLLAVCEVCLHSLVVIGFWSCFSVCILSSRRAWRLFSILRLHSWFHKFHSDVSSVLRPARRLVRAGLLS